MSIVCGTDFSLNSTRAVRVAALLAHRFGEPLALVHVVDWSQTELLGTTALAVNPARDRLRTSADRIRGRGIAVTEEIAGGAPDEVLVDYARRTSARLIVVASLGRRRPARWLLGSVAERTTQTSSVPVLVVRRSAGFLRWVEKGWPLRAIVGGDFSATGDAALGWVRELCRLGPCDVVVAHVYAPVAERRRLGLEDPTAGVDDARTQIENSLLRDLAERAALVGRVRFRVETSQGRVADQLVGMAIEEGADVLVVGTRQRRGTSRLWYGSVSNAALHLAPMNVLSVPAAERRHVRPIPRLRRVLVPTDFSELGDRAVPHAYATLAAGGAVHLLHVVESAAEPATPEERATQERALVEKLQALIPDGAEARGIETHVEILENKDAGAAICSTAERLGVDLICLASHGRSGLVSTLAGSVARRVLRRTTRPLLIVRAPDDD
jgi:nucleotide-binding universal stress UspA family protein